MFFGCLKSLYDSSVKFKFAAMQDVELVSTAIVVVSEAGDKTAAIGMNLKNR